MGACQILTVGRGPKITLETLDIHPLCNMSTDCRQGEQNEPQIIIRCIAHSAMSKPQLEKCTWQGRERGEVMCVRKVLTWEEIFVPAGSSSPEKRRENKAKEKCFIVLQGESRPSDEIDKVNNAFLIPILKYSQRKYMVVTEGFRPLATCLGVSLGESEPGSGLSIRISTFIRKDLSVS